MKVRKIRGKAGSRFMICVHVLEILIYGQKVSKIQTLVLIEIQRKRDKGVKREIERERTHK